MSGNTFFIGFEPAFMEWLQSHLGTAGEYIAVFFTMLSEPIVVIAIMCFLYWCIDKERGKKIAEMLVLATVICPLLKNIFLRRRPYIVHDNVRCIRPPEPGQPINDIAIQGYSFPSAHSSNAAVMFTAFSRFYGRKILKVLAIVAPILVALSRVALGVHYPTDVLTGLAVGYISVFLISLMYKRVKNMTLLRILILVLSSVGFLYCRTEDYFTCIGTLAGLYAAIPFEEHFVKFENTRKPLPMLLRYAIGLSLYVGLGALFKMPFDKAFLESGTLAALSVRAARYFLIVFLLIGVYPLSFKLWEKKS